MVDSGRTYNVKTCSGSTFTRGSNLLCEVSHRNRTVAFLYSSECQESLWQQGKFFSTNQQLNHQQPISCQQALSNSAYFVTFPGRLPTPPSQEPQSNVRKTLDLETWRKDNSCMHTKSSGKVSVTSYFTSEFR